MPELQNCGYNDCDEEMLESQSSMITFDHYVVFLCEEHYPIVLKYNEKFLEDLRNAPMC